MEEPLILAATDSSLPRLLRLVVLFFTMFFTLVFASIILSGEEPPNIVLVSFAFLYSLFLGGLILDLLQAWMAGKAERILRMLIVRLDGGRIVFRAPIRARLVEYTSFTRDRWSRKLPLASTVGLGEFVEASVHDVGEPRYGIVIDGKGRGGIVVRGLEFKGSPLNKVLLLYIPGMKPKARDLIDIVEAPWGAQLHLRIEEGPGLRGTARLLGEGQAKIYLESWILRLPMANPARVPVAEIHSNEEKTIQTELSPDTPIYIVLKKGQNILSFSRKLPRPFIAGNMVSYGLRVVLRRGIRKYERSLELPVYF